MTLRPSRTFFPGTLSFLAGATVLVCGLSLLVAALPDREGSGGIAVLAASDLQVAGPHPSTRRPSAELRAAASEATVLIMPQGQQAIPKVPRPGVPSVRDVPATMDAAAMRRATARWTEGWYRTVVEDEAGVRGYLVRSAAARWAARWHRAVMAWDDTSGYGTLEANRAARAADAHTVDCPCEQEQAMASPWVDPRTEIIRTGAWSRERSRTGVRSTTLFWGTASRGSRDVTSAVARP